MVEDFTVMVLGNLTLMNIIGTGSDEGDHACLVEGIDGGLENARKEIKDVERKLNEVFPEEAIRITNIKEEGKEGVQRLMENGKVIHFELHSEFDSNNPLLSKILLSKEEHFTARDIMNMKMPAYLVVMGSCYSANQNPSKGDEPFGLPRAFFQADVRTVIASPFPVPDVYAPELMEMFYENINKGMDRAKAMQEDQISFIESKDPEKKFPPSWGFEVFGKV